MTLTFDLQTGCFCCDKELSASRVLFQMKLCK